MTDIESLGYGLVYKAAEGDSAHGNSDTSDSKIRISSQFRALPGMQKETLILDGSTGAQWRLVSDEGPYLNGTDLAPSPLAFYTTGMAFSFTTELLKHAKAAGIGLKSYKLTQDNFYTMEGSALRGNMIGGALPAELTVEIESDATTEAIQALVDKAAQTSPAQRYMSDELANTFGLRHNGRTIDAADVNQSPNELHPEPTANFEEAKPVAADRFERDIITKVNSTETLFGVEGGAGSSLQASQKRTLHLRGIVTLLDSGLMQCDVQLFKPLGSLFRFVGDTAGVTAPPSLAYLSAGVGFCFLTQIGRYAQIVKQDLTGYSAVQDTTFVIGDEHAEALPVDTHTFIESGEDDAAMQKNLYMSERTCFLHAAMRGSTKSKITLKHG